MLCILQKLCGSKTNESYRFSIRFSSFGVLVLARPWQGIMHNSIVYEQQYFIASLFMLSFGKEAQWWRLNFKVIL